jgi:hypothetical protein
MARPAYATEHVHEEEESFVREQKPKMVSRIEKKSPRAQRPIRLDDVLLQSRTRTLTEVNLPPRTRTVPPQDFSIALETKKTTPTEYHIVRLK